MGCVQYRKEGEKFTYKDVPTELFHKDARFDKQQGYRIALNPSSGKVNEMLRGGQAVVNGLVEEGLLLRAKSGKLSMAKEYKKVVREMGGAKRVDVNDCRDDRVNDSRNDKVNDSRNDSVKKTYDAIKAHPGIQRKGIAGIIGKSVATIDRYIAQLVEEDLIEHRYSDKKGGYYAK